MERMNHEPGWMVERAIETRGDALGIGAKIRFK